VLPGLRERRWEFRDEVFAQWCELVPQGAIPNPGALRELYASEGPWVLDPIRAEMPRFLGSLSPSFLRGALGDDVPRCNLGQLIDVAGEFIAHYPEHDRFQRQRDGQRRKAGRDLSKRLERVALTFVELEYFVFNAVVGL
jgi:hypothetical protein